MNSSPFYTEDHEAFRSVVRQFTEKEIVPHIAEWEEAGEVPRNLYKKASEVGIFGDGFDAEYGGHGQRDAILRMVIFHPFPSNLIVFLRLLFSLLEHYLAIFIVSFF